MFGLRLSYKSDSFEEEFQHFLSKRQVVPIELKISVEEIISSVREEGDEALKKYSLEYEGSFREDFKITKEEILNSSKELDKRIFESLEFSYRRLKEYHQDCFEKIHLESLTNGIGRLIKPIESVCIYAPGGKAVYPSTILMAAAPARVAGVRRLVLCTPNPLDNIKSLISAATLIAGIDELYFLGGAQSIAAMAIGTQTVDRVDKIVGPGNKYVSEAKRQLYGEVGLDSIAGPSEIVILASEASNPEKVAWDLMAQSEHDQDATSVVISDSKNLLSEVRHVISREIGSLKRGKIIQESLLRNGAEIYIKDNKDALAIINKIAPEHLHIAFDDKELSKKELIAGVILIGEDSANAFSDYVVGPSHILPTSSSARFSSPLSVEDFLINSSIIELNAEQNPEYFNELILHTSRLAEAEGLEAHSKSVEIRKIKT